MTRLDMLGWVAYADTYCSSLPPPPQKSPNLHRDDCAAQARLINAQHMGRQRRRQCCSLLHCRCAPCR